MYKHITAALVAYPLTIALSAVAGNALADGEGLTPIQELGEKIFFDEKLSIRKNQSCASCHDPDVGWTGPDSEINAHGGVLEGSIRDKFGNRKPPSSAYASLAPIFYSDYGNRLLGDNDQSLASDPLFVGGNFWDGRATGWELGNPAADQAQGPFLNPVEQALPDAACVVYRVCEGKYGDLFDTVWGPNACMIDWPTPGQGKGTGQGRGAIDSECNKTDGVVDLSPQDRNKVNAAYDRVALSIAAFEGSNASNAFTSKIDAHRAGLYDFTAEESLGRQIFRGKGQCSACHFGSRGPGAAPPLFTDFSYSNLGTPRNPENPFSEANTDWRDPGLAGFLENVPDYSVYASSNLGKQKVPTLRNVGLGSCEAENTEGCIVKAYMHNGYFKSLKSVVHFYNTRDVKPGCESLDIYDATEEIALANNCWPAPEIIENIDDRLGDLGLTEEEEDALVAFMLIMSDGYLPAQ